MEIYTHLSRFFPNQFRQPTGWLGKIVGHLESRRNEAANDFTLTHLQVQLRDTVLEAGFGPGVTVHKLARLASAGRVVGIDFSAAMAAQAREQNAATIRAGRVLLGLGDICRLPFRGACFDKIVMVSVIYFFDDPVACLRELNRVLRPGGRVGIYLTAKEDLLKVKFTQVGKFNLYTGEELMGLLGEAGYVGMRYETTTINQRTGICVLGEKAV